LMTLIAYLFLQRHRLQIAKREKKKDRRASAVTDLTGDPASIA
jgi:hypothetical protein